MHLHSGVSGLKLEGISPCEVDLGGSAFSDCPLLHLMPCLLVNVLFSLPSLLVVIFSGVVLASCARLGLEPIPGVGTGIGRS